VSDHTSTARQVAEEIGCSVATVNNKAAKLGFKLKGRSPANHSRLLDALKSVKPRKKRAKVKSPKAEARKAPAAPRRRGKAKSSHLAFAGDVDAYFKQGKALIAEVRKRLAEVENEKEELTAKLKALLLLHPDK
jgi:hypothetical protein